VALDALVYVSALAHPCACTCDSCSRHSHSPAHVVRRVPNHHKDRCFLLLANALRVPSVINSKPALGSARSNVSTRQIPRRARISDRIKIRMLDVHAGDVVGQQHDLVAVQFSLYLLGRLLVDLFISRVIKFPVPTNGSNTCTPLSLRLRPNSALSTSPRSHHEVNNRLWV